MTKTFLIILGLIAAAGLVYFTSQPRPDQTKTQGSPETTITTATPTPTISDDDSLTTIDQELESTQLEDFDQEIDTLDDSINQL